MEIVRTQGTGPDPTRSQYLDTDNIDTGHHHSSQYPPPRRPGTTRVTRSTHIEI